MCRRWYSFMVDSSRKAYLEFKTRAMPSSVLLTKTLGCFDCM